MGFKLKLFQYMLTPYNPPPTPGSYRAAYNASMVSTRVMIERTFGIFKGRWQCLKVGLRYKAEKACKIIVACAVLHNLIYDFGDSSYEADSGDAELFPIDHDAPLDANETTGPKRRRNTEVEEGRLYRERLAKTYFAKN